MSLTQTPSGERLHIGLFGKRNAGKSSLMNAITGQAHSVVSDVAGTTTDPVKKAMELLPIGAVVITDTPGFDDEGELGTLRIEKTEQALASTDIALIVTDSIRPMDKSETDFVQALEAKKLPYIIIHNKSDLLDAIPSASDKEIWVSASKNINIHELKEKIASVAKLTTSDRRIISDMLNAGDVVILVTPIDSSAPKGRLILPQQQTIRDIIDSRCTAIVCQDTELTHTLDALKNPPKMVITDSQAFGKVAKLVPRDIPLTSFSILFARYKGELDTLVKGAFALEKLRPGDKILISEGCTHHRQCGDIGTVKLPAWIKEFCGGEVEFDFTSGGEFPKKLEEYKLILHCGGCMLNEAEMKHRINTAISAGVPMVNYGIAIAHMNGILKRSLEIFPHIANILTE